MAHAYIEILYCKTVRSHCKYRSELSQQDAKAIIAPRAAAGSYMSKNSTQPLR